VTDAELIVASRRDPAAFRELYDRWADKLLAWFYHRLGIAVPALDDESIARIEALADAAAHRPALTAALARMTDRERDAVQLRVVEELAYPEIAAKLGCSEGAARTRVHRGLARLARLLEATP
jgi:RNA polymerase sigma factor (sigma-70 family)